MDVKYDSANDIKGDGLRNSSGSSDGGVLRKVVEEMLG